MSPFRLISRKFAADSGFLRRISPTCCSREFSTVSADRHFPPPPSTTAPWLMQPPAFLGGDAIYNFNSPRTGNFMSSDEGNLFLSESDSLADRRRVDLPAFPGCIWAPSKVCSPYDEWTTPIIEETEESIFGVPNELEGWDLASKAFPKQFKGRMGGVSHRGNFICFGKYALKALEPGWITARQIEAGRRAMVRNARGAKIYVRVIADKPITLKPAETRMGRGKGSPAFRVGVVQPGRILYELEGVAENVAKKAVIIAASKLPMQTQFICSGYAM